MSSINVALEGDQVFQKYIAKKSATQRELCFEAMDRSYIGFVTGLDQTWVRLTETNTLEPVLVRVSNINSVSETGKAISDLEASQAERIRAFTGLFRKASENELDRNNRK